VEADGGDAIELPDAATGRGARRAGPAAAVTPSHSALEEAAEGRSRTSARVLRAAGPRLRRPQSFAALAILISLVAVLLFAAGAPAQEETPGAGVYTQQCQQCHGAEGEGGIGPDLRDLESADAVAQKVRAGGGGMPAFEGILDDEEIEAVSTYVVEQLGEPIAEPEEPGETEEPQPTESPEAPETPEPEVPEPAPGQTGEEIYAQACATCHRDDGEGDVGPSLAAAAFTDIVEEKVRVGGGGMPAFEGSLDDEQIDLVSTHVVEEIADQEAREATVPEGGETYRLYCAGCHGASGRGGALTAGPNAPSFEGMPAANALSAMLVGPGNMPSFAGALDSRQQAAVALYVQVLTDPPAPGGHGLGFMGPVIEGAVAWAATLLLVLVSIWLAWSKVGGRHE
jgi:ubiquinol-cytochrome c reductase cytochrome c subunit